MKLRKYEKDALKKVLREKQRKDKEIEKMFSKRILPVKLNESSKIAKHFDFLGEASVEFFCIACFDTKFNLLSNKIISKGNVNTCLICKRELLVFALLSDAVNVVVFHNHPSGDIAESKEDIEGTRDLKKAFTAVGINLVDSLIIAKNNKFNSLYEYFI